MKSSMVNYVFAHTIPIAACSGAMILTVAVSWKCAPAIRSGGFSVSIILAVLSSIPLGLILGYFLLGFPLFFIGRLTNGAPFHEDDWVRILIGPYKGQVVRVYEVWKERNQ